MSDVHAPGVEPSADSDLSPEGGQSPEQQKVELEIIPGAFDQDKSPEISNAVPFEITTGRDQCTSVLRRTVSTLYNPDGRIEASVPFAYLLARQKAKRDVPVVIGEIASEDSYILMPSGQKECPKMPPNIEGYESFDARRLEMPLAIIADFLLLNNFFSGNNNWTYKVLTPPRNPAKEWQRLIQAGKIKFVDEEKAAKFRGSTQRPKLDHASETIKRQLRNASEVFYFPEKRSLFLSEGKLHLFDWSDEIASNWSITEFELPAAIFLEVTAAGLDPRDNFLLVGSKNILYVLDHHKKPMEIVFSLENPDGGLDGQINLMEDGSILVGNKSGNLTSIISNLHTFVSHKERLEQARVLQRLRAKQRTRAAKEKAGGAGAATVAPEMDEISDEIATQFTDDIAAATSVR